MDEWSFALLSCKVFVRCHLAGSVIYHKGETSDYAYVILGGSVKVSARDGAAAVDRTHGGGIVVKCLICCRIARSGWLSCAAVQLRP
jgi:CRP-like cAMP-binding protein